MSLKSERCLYFAITEMKGIIKVCYHEGHAGAPPSRGTQGHRLRGARTRTITSLLGNMPEQGVNVMGCNRGALMEQATGTPLSILAPSAPPKEAKGNFWGSQDYIKP